MLLIAGDLVNASDVRKDISTELIADLCKIAPMYLTLDNHEVEYQEN